MPPKSSRVRVRATNNTITTTTTTTTTNSGAWPCTEADAARQKVLDTLKGRNTDESRVAVLRTYLDQKLPGLTKRNLDIFAHITIFEERFPEEWRRVRATASWREDLEAWLPKLRDGATEALVVCRGIKAVWPDFAWVIGPYSGPAVWSTSLLRDLRAYARLTAENPAAAVERLAGCIKDRVTVRKGRQGQGKEAILQSKDIKTAREELEMRPLPPRPSSRASNDSAATTASISADRVSANLATASASATEVSRSQHRSPPPASTTDTLASADVLSMSKTSTDTGDIGALSFNTLRLSGMPDAARTSPSASAHPHITSLSSNHSYAPSQTSRISSQDLPAAASASVSVSSSPSQSLPRPSGHGEEEEDEDEEAVDSPPSVEIGRGHEAHFLDEPSLRSEFLVDGSASRRNTADSSPIPLAPVASRPQALVDSAAAATTTTTTTTTASIDCAKAMRQMQLVIKRNVDNDQFALEQDPANRILQDRMAESKAVQRMWAAFAANIPEHFE